MDVRIEKLVYGGDGLGHHDGNTVFVPLVLPGELVRIESATRKKKFIRGRLDSVVEPSPERVAAPCPHFGRCGGCQYQHIPYEAQIRYKSEILRETLGRVGRIQWTGPIGTHASPPFGYRNRAQWKLRPQPDGAAGSAAIGYFEMGSTRLCAATECSILSPRLAETFARLRQMVSQGQTLSAIDEIEAFTDSSGEKLLLNLSAERLTGSAESISAALRQAVPNVESIFIQDRRADKFHLDGPGYLTYTVGGAQFRVGHLSFFQVNRFMVEPLVDAVIADTKGKLALDLFAGVGLFTVALTRQFERVIGVESNLAAAKDLETNLKASGGASPAARNITAEAFLSRWHEKPDLIVVDPPRAGVEVEALAHIKKLAPAHLHYVSCDPATLARDLAQLVGTNGAGPYLIESINLFDIFPQTYHMEVLVRLRRSA
ncbi:MAG TPA: 23S rRNA (uracil(1939)-C(5))-methyltransferase RlmD [Candidatus Acidoferrales bacterium]|nr:23S rRNA (uracil(1939)-C(5))-methyltransferase RlmD [Candidatus Acidoferrales bacterium]